MYAVTEKQSKLLNFRSPKNKRFPKNIYDDFSIAGTSFCKVKFSDFEFSWVGTHEQILQKIIELNNLFQNI